MLNTFVREYPVTSNNDVNTLEVKIQYRLGGYDFGSGGVAERGYWFSVQPLKVENRSSYTVRSMTAFSGRKTCLVPCGRQSRKKYETAKAMVPELMRTLVAQFCKEEGYRIIDENSYTEYEEER